jgi:hypothetical protein
MNGMTKTALCVLAVLLIAYTAFPQSSPNPLQGVWKTIEAAYTGANARTISAPQPFLATFTTKYYSIVGVMSDKPRPELPQPLNNATAQQILVTWGPFDANSGIYEINGSEITIHPVVAKMPAMMKDGSFTTYTFKVERNTLTLTAKATQAGQIMDPTTLKLMRVE